MYCPSTFIVYCIYPCTVLAFSVHYAFMSTHSSIESQSPFAYLRGNRFSVESDFGLSHLLSNSFRHVLIESAQQNWPHHNRYIETRAFQKSSAFQRHVRSANNQRFSGRIRQLEDVVTTTKSRPWNAFTSHRKIPYVPGNAIFFGSWNIQVARSQAGGDEESVCRQLFFCAVFVRGLNRKVTLVTLWRAKQKKKAELTTIVCVPINFPYEFKYFTCFCRNDTRPPQFSDEICAWTASFIAFQSCVKAKTQTIYDTEHGKRKHRC